MIDLSNKFTKEEKKEYLELEEQWDNHFYEIGMDIYMSEFWMFLERQKDVIWIELPFSIFLPILQWKLLHFKELWEKYEDWEQIDDKWEKFYTLQLQFHPSIMGEGPPLPMSDGFFDLIYR
jgi:hypothetical protein